MARALLVALWVACAAAARYGDYSGARMPQYGGDYDAREPHGAAHDDDYRGHSPDAPAALDYKYEEDLSGLQIGKTEPPPVKEADGSDSWQRRPARKHKKSRADVDIHTDPVPKFDPDDDFPKPRSRNRFIKHLKGRKFERQDNDSPKYPVKLRGRDDDSDVEDDSHKDFRNDKSESFEEDRIAAKVASERVVRRKPRDRQMKRKELDNEEQSKDDSESDQWVQQGQGRAPPPPLRPLEPRPARRRPTMEPEAKPSRVLDDDDSPIIPKTRGKPKIYDDYSSDYYDMKRVMNIKNKLPTLMRRPTVSEEPLEPTQSLEEFLMNRRAFPRVSPIAIPSSRETEPPDIPAPSRSTGPPPRTFTPPTSTTTTTAITTTVVRKEASKIMNELSLAEKSRLSILRKAQRKESLHLDRSTTKPPVLLQVTSKLPTVVMVEPPSSPQPWMMRAHEVFDDSPERLAKVKRLMRHKLVENAKNIHELTDNWDDLVCDYIDTSLLDAPSASSSSRLLCVDVPFVTILLQVIVLFR